MLYMTPGQFRRMATGADLSQLSSTTDSDLAQILSLSTSAVNRWCSVPKLPQMHDFRGGSITGEQQDYPVGNVMWPGSDKFWPFHKPVKAVSQFKLQITPSQAVVFDPSDLYINLTDGYIEVISLARRLSVFSAGYIPILGMREPVAVVDYTYGWTFPVTGEMFYPDDSLKVFRGENQWWTSDTVTVYIDGVDHTSDFTIDRNEGTLTRATQVPSTSVVTVDYTYTLPTDIAHAVAIVASNAINANAFQQANVRGLQEMKVEETEVRFERGMVVFEELVDERAQGLLAAYKQYSWS